jgi:hypothetical protein
LMLVPAAVHDSDHTTSVMSIEHHVLSPCPWHIWYTRRTLHKPEDADAGMRDNPKLHIS